MKKASVYIKKLALEFHIEGGYYKEMYRCKEELNLEGYEEPRPLSTTIYYLLEAGQVSKFHRLQWDELWFFHDGAPFIIHMIHKDGSKTHVTLGLDVAKGQVPQCLIPAGVIFGAEMTGEFGLASCMVSPGFDYRDFQLYSSKELIEAYPQYEKVIRRLNG